MRNRYEKNQKNHRLAVQKINRTPLNELKKYIDQIIRLDDKSWDAFSDLFSEADLAKGDYFANENRVETKIGFLLDGTVRAFYRNIEGIEYNKTFFTGNEFIGAYASLVTQRPNRINLQALTDCRLLIADYSQITKLFAAYRPIETLARRIAEQFYIQKEERELEIVLLQADERYKLFRESYPGLENSIPQYHIASYLGITPTQLSRIRAKKK
jgi:CRP-like cAMP-binding protein